jgi:hypothetical protein
MIRDSVPLICPKKDLSIRTEIEKAVSEKSTNGFGITGAAGRK